MGLRSLLGLKKPAPKQPAQAPAPNPDIRAKAKPTTTFQMFVDDDGVPYTDYGTRLDIGRQRSVLSVAERGLWYWIEFRLGGDDQAPLLSYDWRQWPVNKDLAPMSVDAARTMLLNCADWMLREITQKDGFLVWLYPYQFSYETRSGWRSSHAQAVGMQLLARAAKLTGDNRYTEPIDGLLTAFRVPVTRGGVLVVTEGGNPWFEKIADEQNQQPRVLNGMMFAVLGLLDVGRLLLKDDAERLGREGIEAVLELLPQYDRGDWTNYDIRGKRASSHYHTIHIRQLTRLHELTGDARLIEWRNRFHAYGP